MQLHCGPAYTHNSQGPDTQKHLSPTYLLAVHVTAINTTYFIESVYIYTQNSD